MAGPARSFNLRAVSLSIGGIPISGYGEDGAIDIEYPGEAGVDAVGGDGETVFSATNDDRAYVTLTLMETSRANRLLNEIYLQHRAAIDAGGSFPATSFNLFDPVSGDQIKDVQCLFKQVPTPSKAATAGSRVWSLFLPNGRRTARLAANIV